MAWDHLSITDPHLVYLILGGFTTLFMLCSSFIKERLYIGEATVATLCGVIFGPHAANLIDPNSWGSTDIVTIEFSRIVLVVQCFAVGVELPKYYMERHWRSVVLLLIPVMMFGWLIVSLFLWWMIPPFDWLDSLVVAACITATDPVLASSVVGKGKFAKRVPKHLRDLLSAESGCNDGMAFPFVYLSLYLIKYHRDPAEVSLHFVCYTILYECIFGAIFGFVIGYIARHGIRYAERNNLIDRESFLVFYFVVALFCAGSGSLLGLDDLLVGFAAGVGFSNDGWFGEKTEESHVSNVIDLLLNLAYFVYFGTIIPWEQYNSGVEGLTVWRLVVITVFVLFFRRIPIMLALKPFIPDIRTWREALFAGHFGPIGVGAIFVAILARAELETGEAVPLAILPPASAPEYNLIYLVWPIVTFMVISSILVHGSSIAVFTLGKRINTLSLTMSYTQGLEDGPSWMNRLPRISSMSRSQGKMSETSLDEKEPQFPPGTLAPPGPFLSRRSDADGSRRSSRASSLVSRRRKSKKDHGAGGPISQSAIFPNRDLSSLPTSPVMQTEGSDIQAGSSTPPSDGAREIEAEALGGMDGTSDERGRGRGRGRGRDLSESQADRINVYEEGRNLVFENQDGDVLSVQRSLGEDDEPSLPNPVTAGTAADAGLWTINGMRKRMGDYYTTEREKRKGKERSSRKHEPARAYQYGSTIIVEDEDGEVVKTYEIPSIRPEGQPDRLASGLKFVGLGGRGKNTSTSPQVTSGQGEASTSAAANKAVSGMGWTSILDGANIVRRKSNAGAQKESKDKAVDEEEDDVGIRFTIGGVGRRLNKADFIREMQRLDAGTRQEALRSSNAPKEVVSIATQERPTAAAIPTIARHHPSADKDEYDDDLISPLGGPKGGLSSGDHEAQPSTEQGETAVEKRRRLAVLSAQRDDDGGEDDDDETPAARRRREAALGLGDGEDSDDDDQAAAPRIRFAEPQRGR